MDKHAVGGPDTKFAVTGGPMFAQIYVLCPASGGGAGVGGVSRESNGHLNSIQPPPGLMPPPTLKRSDTITG